MSGTVRRATERPRVTLLVVVVLALALAGAGLLGAALAGGDDEPSVGSADAEALAVKLEAEEARSFQLESQLGAALRRIRGLERAAERREERRREAKREARSRSSSGSRGQRPSPENQP